MDKITISIRFEQVNDLHMGHFEAALGRLPPLSIASSQGGALKLVSGEWKHPWHGNMMGKYWE